jgi:hypothetical protein
MNITAEIRLTATIDVDRYTTKDALEAAIGKLVLRNLEGSVKIEGLVLRSLREVQATVVPGSFRGERDNLCSALAADVLGMTTD